MIGSQLPMTQSFSRSRICEFLLCMLQCICVGLVRFDLGSHRTSSRYRASLKDVFPHTHAPALQLAMHVDCRDVYCVVHGCVCCAGWCLLRSLLLRLSWWLSCVVSCVVSCVLLVVVLLFPTDCVIVSSHSLGERKVLIQSDTIALLHCMHCMSNPANQPQNVEPSVVRASSRASAITR